MLFKIYVANLGAYNEGVLKGDWFTLPVDIDEVFETIFDEDELDEDDQPLGDWAIHDTDFPLPFRVNEHDSIEMWNDIINSFENYVSGELYKKVERENFEANTLYDLAMALSAKDAVSEFVTYKDIMNSVTEDLDDEFLYGIKQKIKGIRNTSFNNDKYFLEDGNGHFKSIEDEDLETTLNIILNQFKEQF